MTEPAPADMDEDEHAAWLASLSDDDSLVVHTPSGYQHLMLLAAYVKRTLQREMPAGKRLRFLELLNSLTDSYFTPEMLAAIEPMSDTEIAMMNEARSLDREDDRLGQASFKVLTSWRVFGHFRRLNPSYLAAIKLREQMTAREAAPFFSPFGGDANPNAGSQPGISSQTFGAIGSGVSDLFAGFAASDKIKGDLP